MSKKTKRLKKTKSKRLPKKKKSPFKIVVRDWGVNVGKHQEIEINEDSKLEIHIDGKLYNVSIDKKNRCLEVGTHETHLYIQPVSVHQFLVKTNSKK